MLFQVSGQNGLNNQKAEALKIHVVETGQEVVLRLGHKKIPGRGSVVILQNRAVVVEHRLPKEKDRDMRVLIDRCVQLLLRTVTGHFIYLHSSTTMEQPYN